MSFGDFSERDTPTPLSYHDHLEGVFLCLEISFPYLAWLIPAALSSEPTLTSPKPSLVSCQPCDLTWFPQIFFLFLPSNQRNHFPSFFGINPTVLSRAWGTDARRIHTNSPSSLEVFKLFLFCSSLRGHACLMWLGSQHRATGPSHREELPCGSFRL